MFEAVTSRRLAPTMAAPRLTAGSKIDRLCLRSLASKTCAWRCPEPVSCDNLVQQVGESAKRDRHRQPVCAPFETFAAGRALRSQAGLTAPAAASSPSLSPDKLDDLGGHPRAVLRPSLALLGAIGRRKGAAKESSNIGGYVWVGFPP